MENYFAIHSFADFMKVIVPNREREREKLKRNKTDAYAVIKTIDELAFVFLT